MLGAGRDALAQGNSVPNPSAPLDAGGMTAGAERRAMAPRSVDGAGLELPLEDAIDVGWLPLALPGRAAKLVDGRALGRLNRRDLRRLDAQAGGVRAIFRA